MIFHPRSDWTKVAAANANPVIRSLLKGLAIHWNGPAVPLTALTDPRSYLEGVRRYHVSTKGWSDIAYNYAVDQLGNVWELRGWGYQSGANGDEQVNDRYLAILCIIGQGQTPTPKMLSGVTAAAESFRVTYQDATAVVTHKAIRADGTECPGPHLTRAVAAGTFNTTTVPEDDMQLNEDVSIGSAFASEFGLPADKTYTVAEMLVGGWGHARQAARDAAVARALSEAAARSAHPLTAAETEAVVEKAIAENVVRVDVRVNAPQP